MGKIRNIYKVVLLLLANREIVGREHDKVITLLVEAEGLAQVAEWVGQQKQYGEIYLIEEITEDFNFIKLQKVEE